MKTQINHSQSNRTANYIFFGITVSIFLLSVFFSLNTEKNALYTSAGLTPMLSYNNAPSIAKPVTETTPIDLKQYLTETVEATTAVESWMNETSWASAAALTEYLSADYTEEAIKVEDWMLSTAGWGIPELGSITEAAIPLEEWMLNTDSWEIIKNINFFDESMLVENAITIEEWMLSTSSWKIIELMDEINEPEIAIESWMLNIDEWDLFNSSYANK